VTCVPPPKDRRLVRVHSLIVRATHWVNAFAMACMIMSGWRIYNASPLFRFSFPTWATLVGWLGGAIAWHFASMWLLVGNGLVYIGYGLISQHLRRTLLPLWPDGILLRDIRDAARFCLPRPVGEYNTIQRLAYAAALALGVLAVVSGLALWKPVQLEPLTSLFGGYEVARRIHFAIMTGIAGFILLRLVLVMLVPRSLPSMITGRNSLPMDPKERSQ
jgi:thiosulfate reductase cytochrome b subunit